METRSPEGRKRPDDNDQLPQADILAELRASEARMRAVVETSLDCIIVIDAAGNVVEFNPAAELTFGYRRADVLGREMAQLIIPPAWRDRHRAGMARHAATGEGPVLNRRIELTAVRASGEEFPVELAITQTVVQGRSLFTASLRDLTERRRHEAARDERVRLAALVQDVSVALTGGDDVRDMLRACAEALVRHLDAAFARVWTLNEADNVLELQASAGLYTHTDGPHGRVPVGQFKIGRIAAARQPHLTNDVPHDPHVSDQEWARREGMVSFAGYPLLVDERLVGVMALFARRPLSEAVLQGMASVASGIALGLRRKGAEASLRASEARFRLLADSIPQLAWMTRPDGHIFWYNKRWYAYTGATPAQMEGWGWQAVHDPAELPRVLAKFKAHLASGEPWEDTFPLRRHDGVLRWHLSRALPVRDEQGRILLWFGTNTDISERLEMEEELRRARAELEDRVRARTVELAAANAALQRSNGELEQFAYVASHDLQEPLRKILAFGDRLKGKYSEQLGEQGKDYLERMQAAAARMRTLIEDLLTFSRLATRPQAFRPVDLNEVAREVVSDLEGRLQQTGGAVDVGELPTLEADPTQMRQLLQNLIGNGLKFHRPDVAPRVRVAARAPAGGRCEILVTDNGIGFEEVYAERIFQIFQRLHGRTEYEGTGIGLAVCRKIVERHGGRITAASLPGQGATFTVELPLRQSN